MTLDLSRIASFDSETYRFEAGRKAPPIVCASSSKIVNGKVEGRLLIGPKEAHDTFVQLLEESDIIAFANGAYDLAVLAQAYPSLLPIIFKALRDKKIYDILIAEALNAIYQGHLGELRPGVPLVNPATGKVTKRYSLALCTKLVLGREDAKKNDAWQKSYFLLDGIPVESWPTEPREYPVNDTDNTIEVAIGQIFGMPGEHDWQTVPGIPGVVAEKTICRHCSGELTFSWPPDGDRTCVAAPREPHKNLANMTAQVEAAFAAHLGACHGLRTDGETIEALSLVVTEKAKKAADHFKKFGWVREDGTEDQAAVKRSIAKAYGATGTCSKCGGSGRFQNWDRVPCRGEKLKGRYQGCKAESCAVCGGEQSILKRGSEVICKSILDEQKKSVVEEGCDGTGLDLSTAPQLPRSDGFGVKTNRDTVMESGDEELAAYGEDEFKKSISTYIPYLRTGIHRPLDFSPNVIVATGRYSYEDSPMHQFPRGGGERECIRARGAWCGYPVEMVIGSTDYEAGEICTLAQLTYWLFGFSKMRDAINESGKPGILHSDLAAEVIGIPLPEFLLRLKSKDKQAINFRQAMKPINFGVPGGMGVPKLVLTNRAKNAGFTECERGPAVDRYGVRGYYGIRFCILTGGAHECGTEKIMEWKRRPCPPVCKACVMVVEGMLRPAYFRRYPEVKEYFKWGDKIVRSKKPAPCAVWDAALGRPEVIRERLCLGEGAYSATCNNGFQAMLSDILKDAYVTGTRECYLGVTDDGQESPLAGSRIPLVIHDEPLSELILDTSHLSGPRLAEIMMASGRKFAPDVVWRAETALAFRWSKGMEPVYRDGKLVPWEPS